MFLRRCVAAICLLWPVTAAAANMDMLNVSYDPTREFYEEYNTVFSAYWKEKTGHDVKILQSHGGSGKQARSILDGLKADVVTLALAYDIDVIAEKGKLLPPDWQSKLPAHSSPFVSTVVFLVRQDNPKQIKDWDDLVRPDMQVIMPKPKTSGGALCNYLAAWAYAQQKFNDEAKIRAFMKALYKNVPVLDTGARGSTTTFAQRGIGDVLVSWESEALLAKSKMERDAFDIVYPSITILAEPPVAMVEENAKQKGTTEVARAYLDYLYMPVAQKLGAKHFYRPTDPAIAAEFSGTFPAVSFITIQRLGGWQEVQHKHFDDGGIFDQIYTP